MNTLELTRREALQFGGAGLLGAALASHVAAAGPTKKILYFTKSSGFEHSVVRRKGNELAFSEKVLTEFGKQHGFDVTATKDGRVFDGDHLQYDVYVFFTTGDLTKVGKDKAPAMSPAGKQALLDAIRGGKGFIGVHSATDSFHTAGPRDKNQPHPDPYIAMIGAEFISHGAQQTAHMTLVDPKFPGMEKLGNGFELHDEWYTMKNFAPDLHVLLVNETKGMKGPAYQRPPYPATWARREGKGRVFYTSMGHREDVWTNPIFQDVMLGGMRWTTGLAQADVPPNKDRVTPGAATLGKRKR